VFKTKVLTRYSITALTEDEFYSENGIDPDNLSYAGEGDFGEAFHTGDDRILKKTSSYSEYRIALETQKKKMDGFAEIYATEKINGTYYILQEELEHDSSIEDTMGRLNSMLETQGLSVQYMSHFDDDEYLEQEGDEVIDGRIDPELAHFMTELEDIVRGYRMLGIEASDIRAENMGRDKQGKLKAFDIDDKDPRSHWK